VGIEETGATCGADVGEAAGAMRGTTDGAGGTAMGCPTGENSGAPMGAAHWCHQYPRNRSLWRPVGWTP
jgi:hypothetical protein